VLVLTKLETGWCGSVQGSNNIGGLVESATNVHNLNQYFTLTSKSSVILLYQDRLEMRFNNYRFDSRVRGLNLVIPGLLICLML
jgi:hypothetical protein